VSATRRQKNSVGASGGTPTASVAAPKEPNAADKLRRMIEEYVALVALQKERALTEDEKAKLEELRRRVKGWPAPS